MTLALRGFAVSLVVALVSLGCGDDEPSPLADAVAGSGGSAGSGVGAAGVGGQASAGQAGQGGSAQAGEGGSAGQGAAGSGGLGGATGGQSGQAGGGQAGGGQGGGGQGGGGQGGGGQAGAGQGGLGGEAFLEVEATKGELALSFGISISGKGTNAVGEVAIEGSLGTVEVDGAKVKLVTYEHQPWPEFGYDLYQALGVEGERWHVLWFYCSKGDLVGLYRETTDGTPVIYEAASGSCVAGEPGSVSVELPAVKMPLPKLLEGFSVQGPKIELPDGKPGWIDLGQGFTVLPFNTVDCTQVCGGSKWWELHSLLWDPAKKRVGFTIFYLFPGQAGTQLTYTLTLPDLGDPVNFTSLEATWTGPGGGS